MLWVFRWRNIWLNNRQLQQQPHFDWNLSMYPLMKIYEKILREITINILLMDLFTPKWKFSHHLLLSFQTCGTSVRHKRWNRAMAALFNLMKVNEDWICQAPKLQKALIKVLNMTLFYCITNLLKLFDKCWLIVPTRLCGYS